MSTMKYFKYHNIRILSAALVAVLLWPIIAAASPARTGTPPDAGFTLRQILSSPWPSSLVSSAKSGYTAWVHNREGVSNIWLTRAPEFNSRPLTDFRKDDGYTLAILGFIDNGQTIVFLRDRAHNPAQDPDWDGLSSIYTIDCDGGKQREIARIRGTVAAVCPDSGRMAYAQGGDLYVLSPGGKKPRRRLRARGQLGHLRWSVGGQYLAMENHKGEFPHRWSHIMVYCVETDSVHYISPSSHRDTTPEWSPDGKKLAFLRHLVHGVRGLNLSMKCPVPDPWEIRTVTIGNDKDDEKPETSRSVWRSPASDSSYFADLTWLDNGHLVFISEQDGWRHLYSVAATGGNARQLTKGHYEVEQFTAVPALGQVFFSSNAGDIDRRHISSVDRKGNIKTITRGKGIEWSPVVDPRQKYLFFLGSGGRKPAAVYVKPLRGGAAVPAAPGTLPADFPREDRLTEPQPVMMTAVDGLNIHGQLFLPPASFKGKRPGVIFLHGGPVRQMLLGFHYLSYYHKTYALNQYLASRGFVVLSVNYRLGIGYGRSFRDVPDAGPRGGSEYRDVLAAAAYLRDTARVDPRRIGLWGGSYGGLLTALGLARNSDLFAAGVDLHGVHDWNQWMAWWTREPNQHHRTAWKSSPLADIDGWRSPVLLIHGDDDRNVSFSETLWLADALEQRGVEYQLMVLPDENHSIRLHRNWVKIQNATAAFLEQKLSAK